MWDLIVDTQTREPTRPRIHTRFLPSVRLPMPYSCSSRGNPSSTVVDKFSIDHVSFSILCSQIGANGNFGAFDELSVGLSL